MVIRIIKMFTLLLFSAILIATDNTKTFTAQDVIFYLVYIAFLYQYYRLIREKFHAKK